MEIKMIKEIMDYEESIFFGLSLRQCICSLLALGTSVALYFLAGGSGWLCVLGAAPFALLQGLRSDPQKHPPLTRYTSHQTVRPSHLLDTHRQDGL